MGEIIVFRRFFLSFGRQWRQGQMSLVQYGVNLIWIWASVLLGLTNSVPLLFLQISLLWSLLKAWSDYQCSFLAPAMGNGKKLFLPLIFSVFMGKAAPHVQITTMSFLYLWNLGPWGFYSLSSVLASLWAL